MPVNKPAPPEAASKRPLVAVVVLVVVAIAAAVIYRKVINPPPGAELDTKRSSGGIPVPKSFYPTSELDTKPIESLGIFAADEAMKLVGTSGTIATIVEVPDPASSGTDPMVRSLRLVTAEAASFKERLKGKGVFSFAPELKLVRPEGAIKTAWPAGAFKKLLQNNPPNTTIVAFCNLPAQISPEERTMVSARSGKIIVVGGVVPDVNPLVQQRLIHLAISSKVPVPQPTGTQPETPGEWVRRVYAVLKPTGAGQP